MATTPTLMTADELLRLPDDGLRRELIAGEVKTVAPTGAEHGIYVSVLDGSLGAYVRANRLGRVLTGEPGFLLTVDPDTVRAPDIAFIRRERLQAAGLPTGFWSGAPDLAIEVISPTDLYTEVEAKVAQWLEHGARLVIVVNPRQRRVAIHRSPAEVRYLTADDATLDGDEVVPGWRLPLRDLFASDLD